MTLSELVIRLAELEDEGYDGYQVVVGMGDAYCEVADMDIVCAPLDTAAVAPDDPTGGNWYMINLHLKWPTFHLEDDNETPD